MTQAINFTKDSLDKLPFLAKQYDVGDARQPGLRLRVNPGRSKTFIIYRKIEGKPCRIKLGRFPEMTIEQARRMAQSVLGKISEGANPQTEKRQAKAEPTFRALCEIYFRDHVTPFNRRAKDNRRVLEMHVLTEWGDRKASAITKEDARRLHLAIAERCAARLRGKIATTKRNQGQPTANKAMKLARAAFNFAIDGGHWKGQNPCIRLKRFKEESRDRFLNQGDEINAFYAAIAEENPDVRDFFRLALFSGARKTNVLSMRWEDIDFTLRRWRVRAEASKNAESMVIALPRPALAILKWRLRSQKRAGLVSPFVFPGYGKTGHRTAPRQAFARIKARMGVSDLHIHDLRRTLGSYMAIGGESLPMIGQALGHKDYRTTAIYARLSRDPVLQAVEQAVRLMRS